jgi:cytolysin-activating lysine-acyltransferase
MRFDTEQNDFSKRVAGQIGLATTLMLRSTSYQHYPINCLSAWVEPAIMLKQIKFFFDRHGHPIGYLTWAYLTEDVENRMFRDPKFLLHVSEWNEGDRLWFLDFLAPTGFGSLILRHIRDDMFSTFKEARSVHYNSDGTIRSKSLWRRRGVRP